MKYCVWEKISEFKQFMRSDSYIVKCNSLKIPNWDSSYSFLRDMKYCPYCGNKIRRNKIIKKRGKNEI